MRTVTLYITECRPGMCRFFSENDGGGHCDGWNSCSLTGKEIKLLQTKGNFPSFCPAEEK